MKPSERQELGEGQAQGKSKGKGSPHISLHGARLIAGLTIEQLIDRIEAETGRRYSRGSISAVENGHRGASIELLRALEIVYGLPSDSIDTAYQPRHRSAS
ncbi:helix-turn-helix domain-containing protein [Nocardia fusca]|uniref:Helix-turn-helix transcriptional regulator n=1 Tax=Nocardia fusca TaxID=941183 RepID=A0ABV3FIL7_9NOCA